MSEKIEECLSQLNELLRAAGKIQDGQVAHKVTAARKELDELGGRRDGGRATLLGTFRSADETEICAYRISNGTVQCKTPGWATWTPSLNFSDNRCHECAGLQKWVIMRIHEILGLPSSSTCLGLNASEWRERHRVLRNTVQYALNVD